MKRLSTIVPLFCVAVLAALTACSGGSADDPVIGVKDDDPDMTAAIAEARRTLPQFWQAFEHPKTGESDFGLKAQFKDGDSVEHFWLTEIERTNGRITGVINNEPAHVHTVKLGERVTIPEADISDWLYIRGKNMVGNRTLRVLFKEMPAEEVRKWQSIMVEE